MNTQDGIMLVVLITVTLVVLVILIYKMIYKKKERIDSYDYSYIDTIYRQYMCEEYYKTSTDGIRSMEPEKPKKNLIGGKLL